jgi:potassium/chloride transporter 9
MCVDAQNAETEKKEKKLAGFLRQLRIIGEIMSVTWNHLISLIPESVTEDDMDDVAKHRQHGVGLSVDYIRGINEMVKEQSANTAATFLYLPKPAPDMDLGMQYLEKLEIMTNDLPPTVLVNGIHPVTSTTV